MVRNYLDTVLPCIAIFQYLLPCTTVHDPEEIGFSIWYSVRMPLHQAGRGAAAYVQSTRSKSQFSQDREPLYKVVGTGTEQYKAVLYSDRYVLIQHSDIPSTSGICGKFP